MSPMIRVAAILNTLLEEQPLEQRSALVISQADLAAVSHLGRGSVNAALKELQARGLIRRRYGAIELLRTSALAQLAGRVFSGVRASARRLSA
jgi:DNA-binding MarR family transcriptional regulator